MTNLNDEQGKAFCNVLNAFNEAWSYRQKQTFQKGLSTQFNIDDNRQSYMKLFEALNQPSIENHLGNETKELRLNFGQALRSGDYSKIDDFFDKITHEKNPVELVKIAKIERSNPKLTIASRLNDFAKSVTTAISDLMSRNRAA